MCYISLYAVYFISHTKHYRNTHMSTLVQNLSQRLGNIGAAIIAAGPTVTKMRELVAKNLASRDWTHILYLRYSKKYEEWVFDIPQAGITDEPFVEGIPEIIEYHLDKAGKLDLAQSVGVPVLFTGAAKKPTGFSVGTNITLNALKEEHGGCWYKDKVSGMEGWLCPNLYQYFATSPDRIHICIR